jgi:membrane-associated protein
MTILIIFFITVTLSVMGLLDANSIVSTLGLIGVLGVIFIETGLLIGLILPGGEVVFLAGIAASPAGAALLGDIKLSTPQLFLLAPLAAIAGGEVGYWTGKKYGRDFFIQRKSSLYNKQRVEKIEKWLLLYGPRKALIIGRFIPFVRTLINPVCGIVNLDRKIFSTWNAIGAIIWTQVTIGIGYILGDILGQKAVIYILIVAIFILFLSLIPLFQSKK